jgi:hypothetical protein
MHNYRTALIKSIRTWPIPLLAVAAMLAVYLAMAPASQPSMACEPEAIERSSPREVLPQDIAGTIKILPNPAYVDVGGTVTVTVWLEDVGNYYGLDFKLDFEKATVSVPSGKTTPLWEVFDEDNHLSIKNTVQNVDGIYDQVWYAVTNFNPAEPFTGTGRVCSITFSGLAEGTTVLDFTYAKGSTRDGDEFFPTQVDGSIIVSRPPPEAFFDVPLYAGWNLVSFPLIAAESSPRALLSEIEANYDLVYAWNSATLSWDSFMPLLPDPQTLDSLDLTQGFWIRLTSDDTLSVGGWYPSETSIVLNTGWNLVGFPASEPQAIEAALGSIAGKFGLVYEYDASGPADAWRRYDPGAPPYASTLTALTPGMGYWINVTESCTWVVAY